MDVSLNHISLRCNRGTCWIELEYPGRSCKNTRHELQQGDSVAVKTLLVPQNFIHSVGSFNPQEGVVIFVLFLRINHFGSSGPRPNNERLEFIL
jgi:hypothetical protein